MDGSIEEWDPNHDGTNENSANTTYDRFVGGQFIRIQGLYLAALRAAEEMAKIKGDTTSVSFYRSLYDQGFVSLNNNTYNGEYYYQRSDLPPYPADQFGTAVVSDHLTGQTHAFLNDLGYIQPADRIKQSSNSVFKYNFFSPVGENYKATDIVNTLS